MRFGYLSSYPPTRCGLATFTEALSLAMTDTPDADEAVVVRVLDEASGTVGAALDAVATAPLAAPPRHEMIGGDERSIRSAAHVLNGCDVAIVQHEYGIYGGVDGEEVLQLLRALTVPSIVVLHTVLAAPTPGQKQVLEAVGALATVIVVMTESARDVLGVHYDVDHSRVQIIPHGVASWAPLKGTSARSVPSDRAHPTVLSWGLVGPGKGIEWGIRAFALLRETQPEARYLVLGQTHPKVLAHEGDVYRDSLHGLVRELGLEDRVRIDARYLSAVELAVAVHAAAAVLLPYESRTQVTSGVLAEAVAAGKPVVATAFPHAVELLSGGVGVVVPHEDPEAIAQALGRILSTKELADRMSSAALMEAEDTSWAAVASRYRSIAVGLRPAVVA